MGDSGSAVRGVNGGPAGSDQMEALLTLLQRMEISGASRRAAILHLERYPALQAKAHYRRLAHEALAGLLNADRAISFELRRGRRVIIWRDRGEAVLTRTLAALGRLLEDLPDSPGILGAPSGELASVFDLPEQMLDLLDALVEVSPARRATPVSPLDLASLARLETVLAQADLSPFLRWRKVMRLRAAGPPAGPLTRIAAEPVCEERYFASHALEAGLALTHALKADAGLFGRLTRLFDRRMLAMLGAAGELRQCRSLGLTLNLATLLSETFLRFDERLPAHLRGAATLSLRLADVLSAPRDFVWARGFLRARGYRLALSGVSAESLRALRLDLAGFDFVHVPVCPALAGLAPPGAALVARGLDRVSDVRWALANGISLGAGRAVAH